MNDVAFNQELKKIARDLELLWDPMARLWGVYQVRASKILTHPSSRIRPWKLFDIMDEHRSFRLPDRRDLIRAFQAVNAGHRLWEKGADQYNQALEQKEADRKVQGQKRIDDRVNQAARDIAYALKVVQPRGRDRGKW